MKFRLIILLISLFTSIFNYKQISSMTRDEFEKTFTEHPIISGLGFFTLAYSANKLFNIYEKKNPRSYIPLIGRCTCFVYPINCFLFLAGMSELLGTYKYSQEDFRIKLKVYLFGIYHLSLASLLFYFCYKRI